MCGNRCIVRALLGSMASAELLCSPMWVDCNWVSHIPVIVIGFGFGWMLMALALSGPKLPVAPVSMAVGTICGGTVVGSCADERCLVWVWWFNFR